VLLGLYLYQWSYDNAREDISRATVSQLHYYLDDLNREIEWMELQQFALLEDNELKKLALTWDVMTKVERHKSLMLVTEKLTTLKTNSPYIENINIHIPEINKTISALYGDVNLYEEYGAYLIEYKSNTIESLFN